MIAIYGKFENLDTISEDFVKDFFNSKYLRFYEERFHYLDPKFIKSDRWESIDDVFWQFAKAMKDAIYDKLSMWYFEEDMVIEIKHKVNLIAYMDMFHSRGSKEEERELERIRSFGFISMGEKLELVKELIKLLREGISDVRMRGWHEFDNWLVWNIQISQYDLTPEIIQVLAAMAYEDLVIVMNIITEEANEKITSRYFYEKLDFKYVQKFVDSRNIHCYTKHS